MTPSSSISSFPLEEMVVGEGQDVLKHRHEVTNKGFILLAIDHLEGANMFPLFILVRRTSYVHEIIFQAVSYFPKQATFSGKKVFQPLLIHRYYVSQHKKKKSINIALDPQMPIGLQYDILVGPYLDSDKQIGSPNPTPTSHTWDLTFAFDSPQRPLSLSQENNEIENNSIDETHILNEIVYSEDSVVWSDSSKPVWLAALQLALRRLYGQDHWMGQADLGSKDRLHKDNTHKSISTKDVMEKLGGFKDSFGSSIKLGELEGLPVRLHFYSPPSESGDAHSYDTMLVPRDQSTIYIEYPPTEVNVEDKCVRCLGDLLSWAVPSLFHKRKSQQDGSYNVAVQPKFVYDSKNVEILIQGVTPDLVIPLYWIYLNAAHWDLFLHVVVRISPSLEVPISM
eukprot:GHVN01016757.1.p1 GENE.GHVN01016757.1~~GHVN01016757.1.p1  ORF type:complete len:420 (-),score=73.36 GHVN01016757.1:1506-2693(-)